MLPHPFKDLEWHKGKKHRHRRLQPLLRGLLATSRYKLVACATHRLLIGNRLGELLIAFGSRLRQATEWQRIAD